MNIVPQLPLLLNPSVQSSLLLISSIKCQPEGTPGSPSSVKQPFAKLLENLFVNPANTGSNYLEPDIPSNDLPNEQIPFANEAAFSKVSHKGNSADRSSECSSVGNKATKNASETVDEIDHSSLSSLILGILPTESSVQPAKNTINGQVGNSSESVSGASLSITAKMEQESTAPLAGLQGQVIGSSASETSVSGDELMSMLFKRAAENPVVIENHSKLLLETSNSPANRGSSVEAEKILSGLLNSGSKFDESKPSIDPIQKLQENVSQILTPLQNPGKNQSSSLDLKDKYLGSSPVLQSTANSSLFIEAKKSSVDNDDRKVNITEAVAQSSEKVSGKILATVDKQGSSKSENSFGNLIKQDKSEMFPAVPTSSKIDPRFDQDLMSVSESGHETVFSKPDVSQVAQTVIREAKMMVQENKTIVNVKLEPESLGSVLLKVSSDNGKISADFNVRTPDAHAYLESSIPQMKQMLESNGVSLSHLSVSLSGGEPQTKQQQYSNRKNSQKFSPSVNSSDERRSFGYNTMEVKV